MSDKTVVFETESVTVDAETTFVEEHREEQAIRDLAKEVRRLKVFERAMESMAAQYICPKTTALEMANEILKKPKAGE